MILMKLFVQFALIGKMMQRFTNAVIYAALNALKTCSGGSKTVPFAEDQ